MSDFAPVTSLWCGSWEFLFLSPELTELILSCKRGPSLGPRDEIETGK